MSTHLKITIPLALGLAIVGHLLSFFLLKLSLFFAGAAALSGGMVLPLVAWWNLVPILLIFLVGCKKQNPVAILALPIFAILWFVPALVATISINQEIRAAKSAVQRLASESIQPALSPTFREYTIIGRGGSYFQSHRSWNRAMRQGQIDRIVFVDRPFQAVFIEGEQATLDVRRYRNVVEYRSKPRADCTEEELERLDYRRSGPPAPFCIVRKDIHSYNNEQPAVPEAWPSVVFVEIIGEDGLTQGELFGEIVGIVAPTDAQLSLEYRTLAFHMQITVQARTVRLNKTFHRPVLLPILTGAVMHHESGFIVPARRIKITEKGPDNVAEVMKAYHDKLESECCDR